MPWYVLGGIDCNFQNVIAAGPEFVPVDIEPLFHPYMEVSLIGEKSHPHDVTMTGVLPQRRSGPLGRTFDCSALGALAEQMTGFREPFWTDVNTDSMRFQQTERKIVATRHLPAREPMLGQHLPEVLTGFETMWRFLEKHKERLLDDAGPLASFRHAQCRIIARNSGVYAGLLTQAGQPRCLADGLDRSWSLNA